MQTGDILIFYRTAFNGPAYYTSVATTIGIVQEVITGIANMEEFIERAKRRSVFSDSELAKHWDYDPLNRPFIVNFLYILSFAQGKRLNLQALQDLGIISSAPRGFEEIRGRAFQMLMEKSNGNQRLIVD